MSANRIASILTEAGHDALVIDSSEQCLDADALIALHAKKSAGTVRRFRELYPDRRLLIYLTGTDLYSDIPRGCEICEETMTLADSLVVSQSASLGSIPERFAEKARVVRKSIALPKGGLEFSKEEKSATPSVVIASHLREVKNPFLVCEALELRPDLELDVFLLGREIEDGYGGAAERWMEKEKRFHWVESCPHEKTLQMMQQSVATLNTSLLEGGANSVGESIVLGTPVLASRIEGNVGMLGEGYAGYFDSADAQGLADLLEKVVSDASFYDALKSQVLKRQAEFSRETELEDWLELLG